ncbi:MAG: NAD(P)H-dependent glycerol-3-phosphate dehydrogenase [Bacteroidota bacterium]
MISKNTSENPVGVVGAGSFGTVIANLLAVNQPVILYARREAVREAIVKEKVHRGQQMHPRVAVTGDLAELAERCTLIWPVVPSKNFRAMMRDLSPHLRPYHVLIHCTKGLDVLLTDREKERFHEIKLNPNRVRTMSQVIAEESVVLRVGCMSGPNLAKEIARGLPAGTVIASHFNEVINLGRQALRSDRFMVFENHDLIGVELGGVLKNILALGSGMVSGMGMGENARALMITRGWRELMRIAGWFGSDKNAFMGLAGIGDMIATCSSPLSRNYTVGRRLAEGETLAHIIETMEEVAEGVNTVRTAMAVVRFMEKRAPMVEAFYSVLFEDVPLEEAIHKLLVHRHGPDVDFM